jgi:Protein of unknown function (DUF1573)
MRRISLGTVSIMLAGAFVVFVVARALTLAATRNALPHLQVNEPAIDLGMIVAGQPVRHVFILANTGRAQLLILEAKSNCECIFEKLPRTVLGPGESTVLDTRFTPKKAGARQERIVLRSNDPQQPDFVLMLKATVVDNGQAFVGPER